MLSMALKLWMTAAFATMTVYYGVHVVSEMREVVSWLYHRDDSDQSTKP